MAVYNVEGSALPSIYGINGSALSVAYNVVGTEVFSGGDTPDYDHYDNEYQHSILQARDEWKTQYRSGHDVIPIVLHTDQHGRFLTSDTGAVGLFTYLGNAIKWNEVSAMIGLGDVDLATANYPQMNTVLNKACPRTKQINIWGNHDLWQNYTTVDGQFVVDFDTTYPNFSNETYGDVSYAYSHKGNEYHIDEAHNIKYVCIAGWEIDANLGGYSHYVISSQSMEDIIEMLEAEDGYDIILLTHCRPWSVSEYYAMSASGTQGDDTLYDTPVEGGSATGNLGANLDSMFTARNNHTSGTVTDQYGVTHSYDFTNCTGKIICGLFGHYHQDFYGWSSSDMLHIAYDAYAYNHRPFYLVNIDRTAQTVTQWKICNNAYWGKYTVPFSDPN